MKKRTIFIGDVHGCYKELMLLLEKIKLTEHDIVYLTGDLINGGPKSYKVLKFLYNNQSQFKSVMGNNDLDFLNWYYGKLEEYNYSTKHFKKIKQKIEEKENYKLIDFLKNLPLYIDENNFTLVHAGIIPGKELNEHTSYEITKIRHWRGKPWYEYYDGTKPIIYGHWAKEGLKVRKNTIGIDSGCVYDKWLTAYILETGEIYSQTSTKRYINLYSQ